MSERKGYQWLLILLLSGNFGIVFFDRNAFSFLTPFIQPELGLSNFQIGLIAGAFSFTWALAGLGVGRLSDYLGRRKLILVVATLVFSLASALSGLAGSFLTLLGARLLMGMAEGGIMPISQTLMRSRESKAKFRKAGKSRKKSAGRFCASSMIHRGVTWRESTSSCTRCLISRHNCARR